MPGGSIFLYPLNDLQNKDVLPDLISGVGCVSFFAPHQTLKKTTTYGKNLQRNC